MRSLAIVLLCFVVATFGLEKLPDSFQDEDGNVYKVVAQSGRTGESMKLYNSTDGLVSDIFNQDGWIVVLDPTRNVCVIEDPNVEEGDCFEEVPYTGTVPDSVQAFCKGKTIMAQVKVPCEERRKRQLSEQPAHLTILAWPRWSRCCRWRRVWWWPCVRPVCQAYNTLQRCVYWGCGLWQWRWRWVRICIEGYEYPYWPYIG